MKLKKKTMIKPIELNDVALKVYDSNLKKKSKTIERLFLCKTGKKCCNQLQRN